MSAYLFYAQDVRPGISAREPKPAVTEVMKQIAEQWAVLHPTQKAKYEAMAAKDKERYFQAKQAWAESHP
ncbi:MAG: HMG-box domain-containing protein [archaeon]|nr:HMG-box domain-containing protein [archaeon]